MFREQGRGDREQGRGRTTIVAVIATVVLTLATACGDGSPDAAPPPPAADTVSVIDDAGRTVSLPHPARRIISLLPATTETLFALGAGDRVVARTDYDTDPYARHLPSVGGGLDPSLETLLGLHPDLVVAWETAGEAQLRERLEALGIPVFAVQTQDTTGVFANVRRLGHLTRQDSAADSLARSIRADLAAVRASVAGRSSPSVLYLIGADPPMTPGPNSFIAQLIGIAGGRMVFPELVSEWPQVSTEEIVRRQPERVIWPVAGSDSQRMRDALRTLAGPGWRELRAVRCGQVAFVEPDLLHRPGPRIALAARELRDAIHDTAVAECGP